MSISVVIPTRHRDTTLARCLEGLGGQTIPPHEVIVTDDAGAQSATAAMLAARFPFARWTPGPARGPAANRNHGASLATGEFVLFLDDDVEPAADLIGAYAAAITPDVNVYEGRTTCVAGVKSPLDTAPVNLTGGWLWSCNLMVRRSCWVAWGGFDEDFPFPHMEDVAFRERLKRLGEKARFVPEASVDHPPRRMATPETLARYHEADFIYKYKYERTRPALLPFVRTLVWHRLRNILVSPVGLDSARAVGAMAREVALTANNWRRWDLKWRGRFPISADSGGQR